MAKKIPKKSYNAEKTERRDPWDFSTSILSQNIKKLEGDILGIFFSKKVSQCQKIEKGPFSLSRYCMLRGKREKTILVQFARPNDSIWDHKDLYNF